MSRLFPRPGWRWLVVLLCAGGAADAQTADSARAGGPARVTGADSARNPSRPQPFQYEKDAGFRYQRGDFSWTTWAFAERLFSPGSRPAWRRFRQGMEVKLPAYGFNLHGQTFRTALIYEVDFTDNNFFQASRRFKIVENLYVTFQDAKDPAKFRLLVGENTHILSREDNLSSGNLPTINRSLILEQHGSTNSFGTQWGVEVQKQISPTLFLQAALQDNRGSLNQDTARFQFWKSTTVKVTKTVLAATDKNPRKLNVGLAVDYTRDIRYRRFTLASALNAVPLGSTPATGNKRTFEHNADYTNRLGKHLYTAEYETIYSTYSDQHLGVAGGYAQLQYQVTDGGRSGGDLVPFVRYEVVQLSTSARAATEQALRLGLNYNLPFTGQFVGFHLEYAHHVLRGSPDILASPARAFEEFRFELRANASRYLRF